jgi:hypothetical protein
MQKKCFKVLLSLLQKNEEFSERYLKVKTIDLSFLLFNHIISFRLIVLTGGETNDKEELDSMQCRRKEGSIGLLRRDST